MSLTMTKDRMRRIDALFSRMVAAEEAIRRDFRELGARADKLTFSFAPAQADQAHDGVGWNAHTFHDEVEGRIQQLGLDRDNPADRRRAAEEVLVEWQRTHPENSGAARRAGSRRRRWGRSARSRACSPADPRELRRDVFVFVERTGFRVSSEQAQRVEDVVRAAFKPVAVG